MSKCDSCGAGAPGRRVLQAETRQAEILAAAVGCAEHGGFSHITRGVVATAAGCHPSLVSHYWGNMEGLRNAVMVEAVRRGVPAVVAQGLAAKHPAALSAPESVRRAAANSLVLP